jgi:hypothetical protein
MKWLGIVAILLGGAVIAYSLIYPTGSYRFRVTLNIDTPQGLRSGSSVMEVTTRRYPAWTTLGNSTGESSLTGEAVFVDLGRGDDGRAQNVIALLALGPRGENVDFYLLPGMAFELLWKQKLGTPEFHGTSWELPKLPPGTKAELRGNRIPTLVTFADLNDPKTARVVQPGDFQQEFGKGITLRDVQIEIVSAGKWPFSVLGLSGEPLTHQIAKQLPSWSQLHEDDKSFRIERAGDPFRVNSGQFQRGF